jgi:hypothetical protein
MASMSATAADALANPPSGTADLEEVWNFLNIGVDHIMNNLGIGISHYTNLYMCAYNYCTPTKMQNNKTDRNRSKTPSYGLFLWFTDSARVYNRSQLRWLPRSVLQIVQLPHCSLEADERGMDLVSLRAGTSPDRI